MIIEAIRSFLPKTYNDRQVRKLQLIADEIDSLEPEMESKSNEELQAQTDRLRSQVNEHIEYGLKYKEALEMVLPEAFATVRGDCSKNSGRTTLQLSTSWWNCNVSWQRGRDENGRR